MANTQFSFHVDLPDVSDENWYLNNLTGSLIRSELFEATVSPVNTVLVRRGASWVNAPLKVWVAGAWRTPNVKVRTGLNWIPI